MKRAMERGIVILGIMVAAGCQGTRYPSCMPRSQAVEAKSYDIHDPYPDETIGPKTGNRPRVFEIPRSDTRKTYDLRNLQAAQASGNLPPPYVRSAGGSTAASADTGWPSPYSTPTVASDSKWWEETAPRYNVVTQ